VALEIIHNWLEKGASHMNSRERMIEVIKRRYHFDAPDVLAAMLKVPREDFIPKEYLNEAYADNAVPIGHGQTISQPYTVAFMTDLLGLTGQENVLEIGTGSGYQAAILSLLAKKVITIERIPELMASASGRLNRLGYKNVKVELGQGSVGWVKESPFEAILVTAGMKAVPKALFEQLKEGGVLVAPVGPGAEKVMCEYKKLDSGEIEKKEHGLFNFVPFVENN
jgi:protein-L-isoaspartate(D-aspartate) O-methyltransferase